MLDLSSVMSDFLEVPAPVSYHDAPKITLSAKGVLAMNTAFQTQAGTERKYNIRISKDGRYIVMQPHGEGKIRFSDKGTLTHRKMRDMLLEREIQLPVCYTLEWQEDQQLWAGCSNDLPAPPARQLLASTRRKKKSED